jgi:hypothetical protein
MAHGHPRQSFSHQPRLASNPTGNMPANVRRKFRRVNFLKNGKLKTVTQQLHASSGLRPPKRARDLTCPHPRPLSNRPCLDLLDKRR